MNGPRSWPLFEVVGAEEASHVGAKGVRLHIAIRPEDANQASRIAQEVIAKSEAYYDVESVFFYPSWEAAARMDRRAIVRGQYVRHDLHATYWPAPLASPHGTVEIAMRHGTLVVERAARAN